MQSHKQSGIASSAQMMNDPKVSKSQQKLEQVSDEPRVTGTVSQLAKLVRHSTNDSMNKTTGNLGSFKNQRRILKTTDQNDEKKDPSEILKDYIMPKH